MRVFSSLPHILRYLFVAMACVCHLSAMAQDERFYRQIFTDELHEAPKKKAYKVSVKTPAYLFDLNRDGTREKILAIKRDGEDFFQLRDSYGQKIFEAKLEVKGGEARLYKIQFKQLSEEADILILYYDEGNSGINVFQSSARVYFAVIENRNLKEIYFKKGPAFYYEKETLDISYARRFYRVNSRDYNGDGVKEISVAFNKTQRIYFYQGRGMWKTL